MKTLTLTALPLSILALLCVAPPAVASTIAECQLQIVALSEETAATTFLKGDKGVKVEMKLLSHLADASQELTGQNSQQAFQQMRDYSSDVSSAVGAGILAAADGAALQTGANSVVACMQQIVP